MPGFGRVFAKYRKLISPKIGAGLIDFTFPEEGLEQIKTRLERHITKLGKRLVIIVDDIDRLQPSEIALVMKLVRLNTRLKGTVFALSFDHEATARKLDDITGKNGSDYIAKIIQKPVKLPKIEQAHLNRFVLMSDHQIPRFDLSALCQQQESLASVSTAGIIQEIDEKMLTIADEEYSKLEPVRVLIRSREKANSIAQLCLKRGEKVYVDGTWEGNRLIVSDTKGQVVRYRLSWLDRILATLIERGKIDFEDTKDFDQFFAYTYRSKISKLIQNLRDAKRYINSLASSLPPIAEEVNIRDFCLLEFLKVFRGDLYDDIYDNWWFYVDTRSQDDVWMSPLISLANDQTKKAQIRKDHAATFLGERVTSATERDLFTEILKELFPSSMGGFIVGSSTGHGQLKKITTMAFIKYFTLKVPAEEIPDGYVKSILVSWKQAAESERAIEGTFLELKDKRQLRAFLRKVRGYLSDISENIAISLIGAIYRSAEILSRQGRENFWNSEQDNAKYLLIALLNDRVSPNTIQELLREIVQGTASLVFGVSLVLSLDRRRGGGWHTVFESIDIGELRHKLAERLKTHFVDGCRNIFDELSDPDEWGFVLHQWGSNWETYQGDTNQTVNDYVLSLSSHSPQTLAAFLAQQREPGHEGWFFNFEGLSKIYNLGEIHRLASESVDDDSLSPEEREVLKRYLSTYPNSIPTIDPSSSIEPNSGPDPTA